MDKLPVSLCMIVKNEEDFLDVALKSVRSVFKLEDIVVVDTGSEDNTKDIALDNKARLFDFEWCDDFSAARNFAASKAENDWIFFIDADEELKDVDFINVKAFLLNINTAGVISLLDLNSNRHSSLARLYNRTYYTFKGRIHEQLCAVSGSKDIILKNISVSMVHHGYLPEFNKVNGKLERNERLLLNELTEKPDNPYLLYQLGKSYFCNERDYHKACDFFEKALNAGATPSVGYTYDLVECYGYALINTEQFEKALILKDTFSIYYNDNAQFRFLSGHIYQNNAMFIEAVECYESCLGAIGYDQTGITSYLSYYNIGVILECIDMIDDAIGMYNNCGDYEPALERLKALT